MDLYCPICGEPVDADELHDVEGMSFRKARDRFFKVGCALFGNAHNAVPNTRAAAFSREMRGLLGDDTDGIVAMGDDFLSFA